MKNKNQFKFPCKICGGREHIFLFAELKNKKTYNSFVCLNCDVIQSTINSKYSITEYMRLDFNKIDSQHIFLQTQHKFSAFKDCLKKVFYLANKDKFLNVIDIGCGVGGFLDYISNYSQNTFGFDASDAQISICKKRHPNVKQSISIDEYLTSLNFNSKFDLITMWDVFEHVRNPQQFLLELRNYCDEKTLIFISVPNGNFARLKVKFFRLFNYPTDLVPWEHVFYYNRESFQSLFQATGYEIIDFGSVPLYERKMSFKEFFRRFFAHIFCFSKYTPQIYCIVKKS